MRPPLKRCTEIKSLLLKLQQYTAVPQTPLLTSQVLKEETEQWPEVQQEMSLALKEMRVDNESAFVIKAPENSSSKLAKKR